MCVCASREFLAWNVVHGQVVHVDLDELQSLILYELDGLGVKELPQVLEGLSVNALAVSSAAESFLQYNLDVLHALYRLPDSQAEIAEPLVVQGNRPVFTQEFSHVRYNPVIVPGSQRVQVVLMQPNKRP